MIIFLGNFCRLTRLFKIVNQRLLCLYLLQQVKTYTKLLDPLLVRDDAGLPLVPEFFYVPRNKVFLNLLLFIYQFTNDLIYRIVSFLFSFNGSIFSKNIEIYSDLVMFPIMKIT